MLRIGNDLHDLAPDALLLNYTNPMAMIPWAVYAGTPFTNVVGVCHSVRDSHAFLAETVGVPEDDIEFRTAGFNHQRFVYVFRRRSSGEVLYPRLRQIVDADPEGLGRRVRVEIFRRFGYFPRESSEHSSEDVPWFLHLDGEVERLRAEIDECVRRSDENLREWEETKAQLDRSEEVEIGSNSELASEIIRAIETGVPHGVYVNVRNDGLIDGLPCHACVEVPARVDGSGVHPSAIGRDPAAVPRAEPNLPERRGAHGARGARGAPGPRLPGGPARPQRRRDAPHSDIVELCDELIAAQAT
jgi:alpha-galactosidase